MPAYDEETLGELLGALPPAPEESVEAAKRIPLARRGLDRILERAGADEDYRRRVIENPEAVLEELDVVAHAETIEILRRRLEPDK